MITSVTSRDIEARLVLMQAALAAGWSSSSEVCSRWVAEAPVDSSELTFVRPT